jgi:DNA-binding transcriptional MocR family regulator
MARKHDKERNDRYFQLHHYMLRTDAWKALSAAAVRVYIQIGSRYNGANNGRLVFSVRDAAGECNLDKGTASRAFKELVDRGFIEETRHGSLSKKTRIASEWRLTAFKCDLTGSLKTCAFMQRGGSEYSSYAPQKRGPLPGALRPSPVRINSRECPKKLPTLSETTPDEATECPKQLPTQADFGTSPVRNNYTHIIYQSLGTDGTAKGSPARPADKRLPRRYST